ncbi:hypothetical protein PG994_014111 [Apiospora phragmitis]|uniref:Uncharacterized protein n=1 Tax=Apiospora phragmitis TaxID=2905665 RepID=A0ABR1T5E0_9PEZI
MTCITASAGYGHSSSSACFLLPTTYPTYPTSTYTAPWTTSTVWATSGTDAVTNPPHTSTATITVTPTPASSSSATAHVITTCSHGAGYGFSCSEVTVYPTTSGAAAASTSSGYPTKPWNPEAAWNEALKDWTKMEKKSPQPRPWYSFFGW